MGNPPESANYFWNGTVVSRDTYDDGKSYIVDLTLEYKGLCGNPLDNPLEEVEARVASIVQRWFEEDMRRQYLSKGYTGGKIDRVLSKTIERGSYGTAYHYTVTVTTRVRQTTLGRVIFEE